jgi:hypothetical protein
MVWWNVHPSVCRSFDHDWTITDERTLTNARPVFKLFWIQFTLNSMWFWTPLI